MGAFKALKATNHFSEFDDPISDDETGVGVVSAATRRATALSNLGLTATAAEINALDGITATVTELNLVDNSAVAMSPGTGADGMDQYGAVARLEGSVYKTTMLVNFDGLLSGGTAGDIIGEDGAANSNIGQVTAAKNGTLVAVRITCLETPAAGAGDDDIDLYSATEATGSNDAAISTLTETQIVNGGAWVAGDVAISTTVPAANEYLYLVSQGTGNTAYTAGIFLIEMWGV